MLVSIAGIARSDHERERVARPGHRELADAGDGRVLLDVARLLLAGLRVEREEQGLFAAAVGGEVDRTAVGGEPGLEDADLAALRVERAGRARGEMQPDQVVFRPAGIAHEEPALAVPAD